MRKHACVLLAALGACGQPPEARLPAAPGAFAPSQVKVEEHAKTGGKQLADVDGCETCHEGVAAQFRTSAHAFASFNNPIYRFTVERLRTERGKAPSRFCAGCHDVSLLVDGAMDGEIAAADPRAHAGITCRTCHGVTAARADGNGSYTLTLAPIPVPHRDDPTSLQRHRARVRPLPGAGLCGTCHRALLGPETGNAHHLAGADDLGPWARSAFSGSLYALVDEPVAPADCRGCHMPLEPVTAPDPAARGDRVRSHRFLGGHTWLSAMRGDAEASARAAEFLRGAASIDVAAVVLPDGTSVVPADGAALPAGERVRLDVVLRSLRVGHRFPGGTLDSHDTWIAVEVDDAAGRRIAEAGLAHERGEEDPGAHRLVALVADRAGRPQRTRETHAFAAVVANHTLPPRDAAVVSYLLDVPARLAEPVRVRARLLHRSRGLPLQVAACVESKTPRGRELAAAARALGGAVLDPCAPQPVTEISATEVFLGKGAPLSRGAPTWRRLADHARGLLHAVQERREEARPSLAAALARAPDAAARAIVHALGAELEAQLGRPVEALAEAALAGAAVGGAPHPALERIRGSAYEGVWRWRLALPHLRAAAAAAPRTTDAWVRLALALESAGEHREALPAARRGLDLNPRHPDLLRVQALALAALGAPEAAAAEAAYLAHRPPDELQRIIEACTAIDAECARERAPVHAHELVAPARAIGGYHRAMQDDPIAAAFDPEAFAARGHALVDTLAAHLRAMHARTGPVLPWRAPEALAAEWPAPPAPAALEDLTARLLDASIHLHHPRYVGHQVTSPLPAAALAELVGALLNNGMAVYEMGPAMSAIERATVSWMAGALGLPSGAGGVFTSGGSIGNLTALLAARQARAGFDAWNAGAEGGPPLAILVSADAHYCVARAAHIMGLGAAGVITVPVDALHRLDPAALPEAFERARAAGRRVFAVVASVCSTATGAFDPLEPIADFCAAHDLWLHADAAHGGAAALSPRYRELLAGIGRADSVVWDAHKMLLQPALATAVLFRDARRSFDTFAQQASYLFDDDARRWDLGLRTLECTKHALALPLYATLAVHGEALLGEYVTRTFDQARRFADLIRAAPDFELAVPPACNILCFRHAPPGLTGDARDAHNAGIRHRICESGAFYLVQTRLEGELWLRTTLMNPLTTDADLAALLEVIRTA